MTFKDIEIPDAEGQDPDGTAMLDSAFRGLDILPGGSDDLRRTVLNQRDQLIGAEAELGTARREIARLERDNDMLRRALHRARRWPFGWIRNLARAMRTIIGRLSRVAP